MRKKTLYVTALAAAVLLAAGGLSPALAGSSSVGTTSANFLKIPSAAVPTAMGEAYTAMVGPDSIMYNPAGLGLLNYSSFSGAHNQYLDGITQEYLALSWRSKYGTIAGAYSTLSSGKIEAYDENDMPIGNTSTGHTLMVLSYAQSWPHFNQDIGKLDPMLITPSWTKIEPVKDYRPKAYRFAAGASIKRIGEKLGDESTDSYAMDAGLALVLPQHWQLGASVQNFGSKRKFLEDSNSLPSSMRFGIAKDFHTINDLMVFTVASDLIKYSDRDYMGATGLEVDFMKMFQMRVGYKTQRDVGSRVSGGFGMNFDRLSDKGGLLHGARIDYAFLDYGSLGGTHRIGVQLIW